jgi:very-short-patch-repair endonuclease
MAREQGIVRGQWAEPAKRERAKELRRAETPEEAALWQRLRRNQLRGLHFRRQQVVDGFIADFYCHEAGLIVELDGAGHAERMPYDQERDQILAARQLKVVRLKNSEIRTDLEGVLDRILTEAASLIDHTGPSPWNPVLGRKPDPNLRRQPSRRHPLPSKGRGPGG